MPRLFLRMSMSLDGFVAGPSQSVEHPIGIGGMRLHEWVRPLAHWRQMVGLEGGEQNASSELLRETADRFGATLMGRDILARNSRTLERGVTVERLVGREPAVVTT